MINLKMLDSFYLSLLRLFIILLFGIFGYVNSFIKERKGKLIVFGVCKKGVKPATFLVYKKQILRNIFPQYTSKKVW